MDRLAEETLHQILALLVVMPDAVFSDPSETPEIPTFVRRRALVLRVCKRWQRVATPLLYETVALRSVTSAQTLAKRLKKHPQLGHCVKKLRIEGGYGKALGAILRATPRLSDLHISMDCGQNVLYIAAMNSALPLVNPSRLLLSGPCLTKGHTKFDSGAMCALNGVQAAAPNWSSLSTVVTSYFNDKVAQAILPVPNLRELHIEGLMRNHDMLEKVLRRWRSCEVHVTETIVPSDEPNLLVELLMKYPNRLIDMQTSLDM